MGAMEEHGYPGSMIEYECESFNLEVINIITVLHAKI